jgi:uncharacterized membrane protein YdjX (TVP38/TMEM64 family)
VKNNEDLKIREKKHGLKRWLPLLLIFICLIFIYSSGLKDFLSFDSLKKHHQALIDWRNKYYLLTALSFMAIYSFTVAISIPGASVLTLFGGFLFGPYFGFLFVFISATLGATALYLAVRLAFTDYLRRKASGWVSRLQQGFQENAFSYLLFLRLIPLFPFWVINIVPAILGVNLNTFIFATALGIIPGTMIYILVGNGLGHIIETNQSPSFDIIFDPMIFYPLLGLAILSLLPMLYQKVKKYKQGKAHDK